jgi:aminoglycoside phosphotransferase (APT) family kinase protein
MKQFLLGTEEAETVLTGHSFGKLTSLEEIKTGSINPVFLVNNKYVLKIDLDNPDNRDKLKKESILFNILPKFSIPTPDLIAFDDTCRTIKHPFILISFIPGHNLKDDFARQENESKNQLSLELGILAKKIHSLTLDDLGSLEVFGNIHSWVKKVKTDFQTYWTLVRNNKYFSEGVNNSIETIFDEYQKISNWEGVGRLIHGDFSPGNIRIKKGHIVGIFDFEFATIADPLLDLEKLPISFQLGTDFDQELFLKGYGLNKFTDQELTRLKMYSLSQGLWEIWATTTQMFPYGENEIEEGKQLVINAINL